jgi:hydrogenase maturation protein HypF
MLAVRNVDEPRRRVRIDVSGVVQGVGFRPFVYRLARELGLTGSVGNSPQGVHIEVEGYADLVESFLTRLDAECPPVSSITSTAVQDLRVSGTESFEIVPSDRHGEPTVDIPADTATCGDCLREVFDPANRRYRYPFTNCTNCGPRYSIIETIPYDRGSTTMRAFSMCGACQNEYDHPDDRRLHAQPNACPACGPKLTFVQGSSTVDSSEPGLAAAAAAIRSGLIVAVKGLGGFHLIVDARNDTAVRTLRARKMREEKPLALMAPNLTSVRRLCEVSDAEYQALVSPQAPIVLLRRRKDAAVADGVAPGNPYLGVMLPYTPLHHILMADLCFPVVATSANLSDEPICFGNEEALDRISGIADAFLLHDRPIARPVDDSVVQVVLDRPMILRRSRGYAPLPIRIARDAPHLLAAGGHMKATIAYASGDRVFLSQHLGDLDSARSIENYEQALAELPGLYGATPNLIVHDAHPDYASSQHASSSGCRLLKVEHHHAHILSCMAEHRISAPVLGVSWDGTGYGSDGTIWGGEFLAVSGATFQRIAHLRQFSLPGGEAAAREPRRSALGMLFEVFGAAAGEMPTPARLSGFTATQLRILLSALAKGVNSPRTTSAGRLFDAFSALMGLRALAAFEGQAAMDLEFALPEVQCDERYTIDISQASSACVLDWEPMLREALDDIRVGLDRGLISARLHNGLSTAIVTVASRAKLETVVLTGGCFQNRYLLSRSAAELRSRGHRVYWNQATPINDGGLALGQALYGALYCAGRKLAEDQPDRVDWAPTDVATREKARPLCV